MGHVKARINEPKISEIEKNNDFESIFIENTSELPERAKVHRLHHMTTKTYKNGMVEVYGSLHKYYNSIKGIEAPNYIEKLKNAKTEDEREKIIKNNKGFNGNDFMLREMLESIDRLCKQLSAKPEQMRVVGLEIGFNLIVDFDPKLFIRGQLYHKGMAFEFKYKRNYTQVVHGNYIIKIYNKSRQYGMDKHVLRVEVKLKRAEEINKLGIYTLADINASTLNNGKDLILRLLNEIVYYDMTISKKGLNETEINNLYKYQSINYWLGELKPQRRDRPKKKLNYLIENNSQNLRQIISKKIIEKCSIITKEFSPEKEQKIQKNKEAKCVTFTREFTPEKEQKIQKNKEAKCVTFTREFTPEKEQKIQANKKTKCVTFTTLNIDENITHLNKRLEYLDESIKNDKKERKKEVKKDEVKRCIITGVNLDLENDNSVYIKTSTIRHLKENDYFRFQDLVKNLIPNTGTIPKHEKNIITHLAKQIRNRYYNPNPIKRIGYNRRRFSNPNQLTLFI